MKNERSFFKMTSLPPPLPYLAELRSFERYTFVGTILTYEVVYRKNGNEYRGSLNLCTLGENTICFDLHSKRILVYPILSLHVHYLDRSARATKYINT